MQQNQPKFKGSKSFKLKNYWLEGQNQEGKSYVVYLPSWGYVIQHMRNNSQDLFMGVVGKRYHDGRDDPLNFVMKNSKDPRTFGRFLEVRRDVEK